MFLQGLNFQIFWQEMFGRKKFSGKGVGEKCFEGKILVGEVLWVMFLVGNILVACYNREG